MCKRIGELPSLHDEARGHPRNEGDEEDEVEDKENPANDIEAVKLVRRHSKYERKSAGAHGQSRVDQFTLSRGY